MQFNPKSKKVKKTIHSVFLKINTYINIILDSINYTYTISHPSDMSTVLFPRRKIPICLSDRYVDDPPMLYTTPEKPVIQQQQPNVEKRSTFVTYCTVDEVDNHGHANYVLKDKLDLTFSGCCKMHPENIRIQEHVRLIAYEAMKRMGKFPRG